MLRYWKFATLSTVLALFIFIVPLNAAVPPTPTLTVVTSTNQPAQVPYGTSVTYTATVTAPTLVPPGAGPAITGTLAFLLDGAPMGGACTAIPLGGTCSASAASLIVGPHTISVVYSGDPAYLTSTGTYSQTVLPFPLLPTNITVTTTSTVYSQLSNLTATITGIPTAILSGGAIQFAVDRINVGTPSALNGSGSTTYGTAAIAAGQHIVSATYSGDPNVTSSTNTASLSIQQAASSTVLTASPSGATSQGTPVAYTATVTPLAPATAATPDGGTVSFFLDGAGSPFATVALAGKVATTPAQTFPLVGSPHTVTAVYNGTSNFAVSTSNLLGATITAVPTTSVVTSSGTPSAFGVSITFNVVVTPNPVVGSNHPSGTVTLNVNGGAQTYLVQLSPGAGVTSTGSVTLPPNALTNLPANTVVATYPGDTTFAASTSPTFTQNVTPANTTTVVSGAPVPNTVVYGQPVNLQANVTVNSPSPTPTPLGRIVFNDTAGALPGSATTLNAVTANYQSVTLSPGTHGITAAYTPNPAAGNVNPSTSTPATTIKVNQASTSIVLTGSTSVSMAPNIQVLTAILTVNAPGAGVPTGYVRFYNNGSTLLNLASVVPISNNQFSAVVNVAPLNGRITAVYSGDTNFLGVTSTVLITTAPSQGSTGISISSSADPAALAQSITYTAVVTYTPSGGFVPSGSVQFSDGATILGASFLGANLQATYTTTLSTGYHNVVATYLGDTFFLPASATYGQQVNRLRSSTALAGSSASPMYGQNVTFTATLGPNSAPSGVALQTGSLEFHDGGNMIGSTSGSSTSRTMTLSNLNAGPHQITAWYVGDNNWTESNSAAMLVQVAQAPTTITLTTTGGTTSNSSVTATVTSTQGVPTGSVSFLDSTSKAFLTSGTLAGGVVTVSVPAGHSVIASYSGDNNFQASSSGPLASIQLSNAASFLTSGNFASNEIVTLMGAGLSNGTLAGTLPLTLALSGTAVTVTDNRGNSRLAELYYVSPTQINFIIPASMPNGPGTVTVTEAGGPTFVSAITLGTMDPGVFFRGTAQQAIAAALVLDQPPTGPAVTSYTASYDAPSQTWSAAPIVLNSTDQFYLELFGTGISNVPAKQITASINGVNVPVTYSGPQNQYPGIDQVNIGPLPAGLAGSGPSSLVLTVNGTTSNTVNLMFQ